MQLRECRRARILQLVIEERSLVRRADWGDILARSQPPVALVALDLGGVDFVSSLFLESCMELGRCLAGRGQELVLVNVSPDHLHLLDVVGAAGRLPVVRTEAELEARLPALQAAGPGAAPEGVTPAEKKALWG